MPRSLDVSMSVEDIYNKDGELRYIKPLGSACAVPLRITQDEWAVITDYPEQPDEDRAIPKVIVHPLFTIALERMSVNLKTQLRPVSRLCISIACPVARHEKTAFFGSYEDEESVARAKALRYLSSAGVVEIIRKYQTKKTKMKEPVSA